MARIKCDLCGWVVPQEKDSYMYVSKENHLLIHKWIKHGIPLPQYDGPKKVSAR